MATNTTRRQVTVRGYTFDRDISRVTVRQYRFGGANVVSVPTERQYPCEWEHFVSSRRGPKQVTEAISRRQAAAMLSAYHAEGAAITRSRVSWALTR